MPRVPSHAVRGGTHGAVKCPEPSFIQARPPGDERSSAEGCPFAWAAMAPCKPHHGKPVIARLTSACYGCPTCGGGESPDRSEALGLLVGNARLVVHAAHAAHAAARHWGSGLLLGRLGHHRLGR